MLVIILTLDNPTDLIGEVEAWGGIPILWHGQHSGPTPPHWRRPQLGRLAERYAIIRSYQAMLAELDQDCIVMQDDIHFTTPPTVDHYDRLTVWTERNRGPAHVCPHAFHLPRHLIQPLRNCWADETRPVCESWRPLTRNADVRYGQVTQWR